MPEQQVTTSRLANTIARAMRRAFEQFRREFDEITRRAEKRFAERDWRGMQADHAERLDVYNRTVQQLADRCPELMEERLHERLVWSSIKAVYSGLILERDDWEIAETFFNSVTRRIFTTVGVDNEIEFVHPDYESPPTQGEQPIYRSYGRQETTAQLFQAVLADYGLCWTAEEIAREAARVAPVVEARLKSVGALRTVELAEMVRSVFYRGEYAYLVGRLSSASHVIPLVISLRHDDTGVHVDAVLTEENDVSLLFSFARSYFHVQVQRPWDLVNFVNSIIPRKRAAELYISFGFNRHGKTELYRNALRHLAASDDLYELARGQRGMVMVVFTMPSYAVVCKIIKDRFDYPKTCTRESVIDRYNLVFKHDRAGRLIDAQEYRYLELERPRFSQALLDELLEVASQTVFVRQDKVVIRHCYAERRVIPLNLYIEEADEEAARAAVLDYGAAIKDLAVTNIFPGDLMLKNFGVTRHGRVVFYDYDELSLLSECNIRELPEDYAGDEPYFGVAQNDMFPEEFAHFMGLPVGLREVFAEHHGDLYTVRYWRELQERLLRGELLHVAPYGDDKRLPR